jgi:hypothetical protein
LRTDPFLGACHYKRNQFLDADWGKITDGLGDEMEECIDEEPPVGKH